MRRKTRFKGRVKGLHAGDKALLTTGVPFSGDTITAKTDDQLKTLWQSNKHQLIVEYVGTCRRPLGFWHYELNLLPPTGGWLYEAVALDAMGLLDPEEQDKLNKFLDDFPEHRATLSPFIDWYERVYQQGKLPSYEDHMGGCIACAWEDYVTRERGSVFNW